MEHAAELLQSEEDFGRSGVRHALDACYSYLHVRGLSGQGLKPLIDLIAALESLDAGNLPELFDPKLRPGQIPERKWSRSAASRETKLHAAACMDALMRMAPRKMKPQRVPHDLGGHECPKERSRRQRSRTGETSCFRAPQTLLTGVALNASLGYLARDPRQSRTWTKSSGRDR
jgi:hypothetical protein